MSKSLFIFDLYNTLIVDNAIEERRGFRVNAIYSAIEAAGLPIRFGQVLDTHDKALIGMADKQKTHFSTSVFDIVRSMCLSLHINDSATLKKIYDIWSYAALQIPPKLIPSIAEGLQHLKEENKNIALISNTASTPGLTLRFLLSEFRIYDYFDDLVFSDDFGFMKPKTMIFERVLSYLNTPAEDAVFIGDHEIYDKFGAQQAGIHYVEMNPKLDFLSVINKALTL